MKRDFVRQEYVIRTLTIQLAIGRPTRAGDGKPEIGFDSE